MLNMLEQYLTTGQITPRQIRGLVESRRIFPCCFGSALKLTGVAEFMDILDQYAQIFPKSRNFPPRFTKFPGIPRATGSPG